MIPVSIVPLAQIRGRVVGVGAGVSSIVGSDPSRAAIVFSNLGSTTLTLYVDSTMSTQPIILLPPGSSPVTWKAADVGPLVTTSFHAQGSAAGGSIGVVEVVILPE